MEVKCLKLDFCISKTRKKWKKEELGAKKPVFELKEITPSKLFFKGTLMQI